MTNDTNRDERSPDTDRRRRSSVRFPERRHGFDRRDRTSRGPGAAYRRALDRFRDDSVAFWTVLATIVVFNFLDLMLTLSALDRGAVEANPVMRALFWTHPLTATLVKLGVVAVVVLMLQRMRPFRSALEVTFALLVGFTALMFYHAGFALGWIG